MALIDGLSRAQLHQLAMNALTAANTLAGSHVYEFADWPTRPELFPILLVSAQKERKVAIFPGTLQFNTTISLVALGRVVGPLPDVVGALVETFSEQIVNTVFLDPIIQHSVQEFRVVEVDNTVRSDGKQHIGEASAVFECVIYQDYGPVGVPLDSVDMTIVPTDTVDPPDPDVPIISVQIIPPPATTP